MSVCEAVNDRNAIAEDEYDEPELKSMQYDRLPFVTPGNGKGRLFWAPRPTGSYNFDCTLGQEYAFAVLPMLMQPGGHQLLRNIVLDMLEHGDAERDRGVIVGMLGEIGAVLENARM